MKITDLLPIGSVVLIGNAKKKLMIYGVKQGKAEEPDKEYDYIGVPYPEGFISPDYTYLFDKDDISAVIFRGFEDIERQNFINKLSEFYDGE